MQETKYISTTNFDLDGTVVKVSVALTIVRDVLPGNDQGITDQEHSEIVKNLRSVEERLFNVIQTSSNG